MKLNFIRKITYVLTSIMLIAAFLLNISLVSVKAAEVSSLPADVGVEVTYDTDNIYLTYEGESFTISRSMLLNSNAPTEYSYPESWAKTCELDHYGYQIPCSYWFSPSEMSIYIMCSSRFAGNSQYRWFYDESYCYTVRSYSDGSFYYTVDNSIFSRKNRVRTYKVDLSDMSSVLYGLITDSNGSSSITVSGYPDDLVCLYSNYTISGFFEPKPSEACYTPDYYFDYQYLFYAENVGYTFVDSALPLVSISHPDPTHALLKFDDVCNKHIYTSVDGIEWTALYTVSGMYSDNASVDYKWFYDSAGGTSVYKLVYCNDGTFDDEPIVTPEYGDITDISNNLNDIVRDDFPFGGRSLGVLSDIWLGSSLIDLIFYSNFVPCYYVYSIEYDDGVVEWYCDFDNKTVGSSYSPDGDRSGSCLECIKILTVYGYLDVVISDIEDMLLTVSSMRLDLHSDLKSVFNNISNTNLYLKKIRDDIDGLPNYFEKFNELINLDTNIKQLLSSIDNKLTSGGSSSGSTSDSLAGFVPFDDTEILDSLVEIDKSIDYIGGLITYQTVTDVFEDLGDNDDLSEVGEFINSAIASMTSNTLLSGAFIYADGITNGINWVNARVDSFYTASGNFKPVIILGAVFFVINLYIRRIN